MKAAGVGSSCWVTLRGIGERMDDGVEKGGG